MIGIAFILKISPRKISLRKVAYIMAFYIGLVFWGLLGVALSWADVGVVDKPLKFMAIMLCVMGIQICALIGDKL